MEPQAETISDLQLIYSNKEIYEKLEVQIPDEVKYCPYNGSYEDMIKIAYNNNDIAVMKALIEYRDAMFERETKIKKLYNLKKLHNQPEQDSQSSGATVN